MTGLVWIGVRLLALILVYGLFRLMGKFAPKGTARPFLESMLGLIGIGLLGAVLFYAFRLFSGQPIDYGLSVLIYAPLVLGFFFVFLFAWRCQYHNIAPPKSRFLRFVIFAPLVMSLTTLLLMFVCMIEGTLCILMAAPFWILASWIGALLAWLIILQIEFVRRRHLFTLSMALMAPFILQPLESKWLSQTIDAPLSTSVMIHASPERVFDLVVAFPQIPNTPPHSLQEVMFTLGLPRPEKATVSCRGVGCLRQCHFTQNIHFDEKILAYHPGRQLRFSVKTVAAPQSLITGVDPHILPGGLYFETAEGQFILKEVAPGETLLTGTSWYHLRSSLNWYAQPWAEWLLHGIHNRVLMHVKRLSEA